MATAARTRLIARLHVMKRDMGLDEDLYRDKLETITGKRSAGELTDAELEMAVKQFGRSEKSLKLERLPGTPQAKLIQALWLSLYNLGVVHDPSDTAILAFVKRQTNIDAARWLNRHEDVLKVVEALKDWLAREGVDWATDKSLPPFMNFPAYRVALAQWRKMIEVGAWVPGRIWNGNAKRPDEELFHFAAAMKDGDPAKWTNAQWSRVTRALGHKLRKAAAKEKAA